MPTFCRHNRFLRNCPICSREQEVELREVVTPGSGASERSRTRAASSPRTPGAGMRGSTVRVRRLARGADDGFHSRIVPSLRSSADAERLANEIAFAEQRLRVLERDPPGLYREIAAGPDLEERTWLAFLTAYLGPLDGEDPFAAISACRVLWASGEFPDLDGVESGPRGAHERSSGTRTIEAYRDWVDRAGSQAAAFGGETYWPAERRFARAFERLALPGLHRDARYELLVTLGRLGVYELRAGALGLGGENEVTLAAKRALGIGDPMLLERRAVELSAACGVSLESLDAGFYNWGRGERTRLGIGAGIEADQATLDVVRGALGL